MSEDIDPARARFFTLGMIRLFGVVSAFLGVAVIAKRWIEPAEVIGGILLLNGAIDVLVIPTLLAKKWRTPKV
jgi:hypothetical protein